MKKLWTKWTSLRNSLQVKIFAAFSLVILFALASIGTIIYLNLTATIKENAVTYVTDSIRHADDSLGAILQDVEHIGSVVVTNQEQVIDILRSEHYEVSYDWFLEQKRIESFLKSLIAYNSAISRIAVVGLNGKIFYEGLPYMDKTSLNRPVVDAVIAASGKKVYIKQSAEETGRDELVTFGRAIHYSNEPIGVVMIDIQYEVIENAYDIRPSEDSRIYVLDAEGMTVYASDSDIPQKEIMDGFIGTNLVKEMDIEGMRTLVVTYTSEATGWTTIGMIPEHTLIKDSLRLRSQIIHVVLFVFAAVLAVSVAVTSRVLKNLRKLRNMMLWVKDGNLTVIDPIKSKDEVGQLSIVFQEMLDQIRTLMEDIKNGERHKREAELAALQAQIRPHFLYNTLNTIKYLARLRNAGNIEEVTTALIQLLRGVLGNTKQFITIGEELDYVRSYINIQKYKYIEPFDVHIQADPGLLSCKIIKLLIQPIVENAIIHGIGPLKEKGQIVIKVQRVGENIRIEVTDNGVGMTEERIGQVLNKRHAATNLSFNSMGIGNVQERIRMTYGEAYGLKIYSEPGVYTTVEIWIPAVRDGEDAHD
mgnify:CR=1 FL=1